MPNYISKLSVDNVLALIRDTAAQTLCANLRNDLTAETGERKSADTALGGRIDEEASARKSADTALGNRIDSVIETLGKKPFYENTCVSMIANNTLKNGDFVLTKGYRKIGDGGNGSYYITNEKPEMFYETLSNGLYAALICNTINPLQIGAYNDDTNPDITYNAIQEAIDSGIEVILTTGTYNIGTHTLDFTKKPQYFSYAFTMSLDSTLKYSGTDCAIKILSYGVSIFKIGLILAPNGDGINAVSSYYTNGGGYLTILNGEIRAGKNALLVGTSYTTGYSNEIKIYDTTLRGEEYGFHAINYVKAGAGEENTFIGQYKLINVSFEGMTKGWCMFFENTGTAAIEDIYLYNLRTTEPLLNGAKLIKSVGQILRVVGCISDPIFTNKIESIRDYISVGSGAKDWNIVIANEGVLTVSSVGQLRYNKTNLIRTQSLNLPANYTYTFTEDIVESTCYLITVQGITNSIWRYAGILFLAGDGSFVEPIISSQITVTVNNKNISIKNTNAENGMDCLASLMPLNIANVTALLEPDN